MLSMLPRSKWLVEAIIIGCQYDCNITLADHVLQSKKYSFNGRLQRKLSSVLLPKYAYITGGLKHPAKTLSLASNEHIDNQCCNTWCK